MFNLQLIVSFGIDLDLFNNNFFITRLKFSRNSTNFKIEKKHIFIYMVFNEKEIRPF